MSTWCKITPQELDRNPFSMIGKEWMLITAEKKNTEPPAPKINTMTASWGGMGVMWNKNTVTIVIRPNRYTKEFLDNGDTFSLTILPEQYRKELSYLGSVSGRCENKIEKAALHVSYEESTPYFDEGNLVFLCKKLYRQPMTEEGFLLKDLITSNYPNGDFHVMYIAEILSILKKTE